MRFPEFSGEWRYSSLWNECDILCGYPFDGQDILEDSGSVKLLRGINITEGEIRHSKELDRYYSGDISRLEKYILKEGDLVLGMDGSKVGRNSAILTISEHGSYLVQRVCRIRSQKHNVEYIFHNINNSKFHRYVDSVKTASAIPHISQSDIQDYIIAFPPTTEEQIKITSLFSLLDQRIATQNKIIEKLKSLIKGIVVSHYSKTARTIKVRIRELGEAYSTKVMSKEQLTNDGNLCVFYGELFTLYGCVIDEVKSRTSLEKVSSTLSHGRDLLFPASTTVDAVSLIAPSALMQKGIILGGDMFGIKVSEAYNPIYLSYYFNYIANKRLAKYAKGTTIIHLHYNEIANVAIELPNIEEQDKIVSTILEYSAKLSIEETILEKLFDLKQYLLKQLFI